jgi:hypothetical protein
MHTLLESRAHEFDGCTESSPEEAEYISLVEAIEAYKQRWCDGKSRRLGLVGGTC